MVFEQIVWSGRRVGLVGIAERGISQQHDAKDDDDQVRDVDFSRVFRVFYFLRIF